VDNYVQTLTGAVESSSYDGVAVNVLAEQLHLPKVVAYSQIGSTFDAAHALASANADAGTLVLADMQTAGRGRSGQAWSSPSGQGIWLTLIERPVDRTSLDVLSLRIGLAAATVLDPFSVEPIQLKWPNDLYVGKKKLAGIMVEARWRDDRPEWVAIGFGVNLTPPDDQPRAAGLKPGVRRTDILCNLIPALRTAAAETGPLTPQELESYAARDLARGKRCIEPLQGRVRGISESGELLVELADSLICVRSGSLVLESF
jgi:BirA family biotin operon repressor/biotin-[acetyl-CoA-carboxylase] ligase